MKKIDKLITTSFIGPSILSFFIATFVLVMQFLWKYIDEILGKGFTVFELLELIFYYAVTLIPLAVPITILISSVMVFGDMAEKYELSSMKSAGISLIRILMPSLGVAILIGFFSLFASNYLKPASNLQFQKRFLSLRKQKSALAIEQGIFNDAFNETIIRVDKIDKNGKDIHDVLIYDHSQNDKSLISITSAKGGQMYSAEEGRFFVMKLDTGVQYRELEKRTNLEGGKSELPFMRTYYDHWTKTFDMSQFDSDEGILNFNRNREDMMNTIQLLKSIDTFNTTVIENKDKVGSRIHSLFSHKIQSSPIDSETEINSQKLETLNKLKHAKAFKLAEDSIISNSDSTGLVSNIDSNPSDKNYSPENITSSKSVKNSIKIVAQKNDLQLNKLKYFSETIDSIHLRDIVVRAQNELSRDRDELITIKSINYDNTRSREKYLLRMNQHYSWAVICIVFLFIGAPLGSIIRKGGYGYPLLVAILFYMIFIISTIFGEKLVKNETMGGIQAAWLPCLLLAPFALILTIMALRDTKFNAKALFEIFYKK